MSSSNVKRRPVKRQKGPRIVTVGIDPGWAKMGVAVLEKRPGQTAKVVLLRLVTTKPTPKKKRPKGMRVAQDDLRRMEELWFELGEIFRTWRPVGIAVEHYAPWPGSMGGNAWKTALGYQLSICAAFTVGWAPILQITRADDLKRAFLGKTKGTKEQTIKVMHQKVTGLQDALEEFSEADHEHVVDAVGHAYLALIEREQACLRSENQ